MGLPTDIGARSVRELLSAAREVLEENPLEALSLAETALRDASTHEAAQSRFIIGTATYRQGKLEEALPVLTEAKTRFSALGDLAGALEAALVLGRIHRDLGEFERAAEVFGAALTLATQTADPQAEADVLNLQAGVLSAQGEYQQALEHLERALTLARDAGLRERQANILNNLGTLRTMLGDYPQALESLKAAYELFRALGSGTRSQATNLISLGHLYQEMGDETQARAFFAQAREVARSAQDPLVEAAAINNLAIVSMRSGDRMLARDLFQEALEIARRVGAKQYEIDNLDGLGQVYVASGDFERAAETHLSALHVAREIGDKEGESDALLNLGKDYLAISQPAKALEPLSVGLTLAQHLGRQPSVFEAHELLSQAYEQSGDLSQALHHYRAFHQAEKGIFNQENEQRTRQLTVQFEVERTRHEAEEQRLRTEVMKQARDEAEAQVRDRTRELEEAQLEIVARLAAAGEFRDDDTGEHTRRVGRNAAALAHTLGWPEDEVQLLFTAARLHDVGKIGVRDAILHKPGKLEIDEMALMRTHTTIGARILSTGHSRLLKLAEEIAFYHHERWDGKGYPLGLAGEAIPISARIVAVADVLDALTHERPYKRAWSVAEAVAEIVRQSGHHFDPQVAAACARVFGPGGVLSPTEVSADWQSTASELQRLPIESPGQRQTRMAPEVAGLQERYEKLLVEKTRELEAARREAQLVSRRLQELAFTDTLTGLGNRRAFEADLEAEVARALQQGDRLSVLALDLDMLKLINDNEGHERGDALLCAFAETISYNLRSLGRVYRVGGDEFMAILVHAGARDFEAISERLANATCALQRAGFLGASVSAGFAALPEEVSAPGDLVRLSDQRMYNDKLRKRASRGAESKLQESSLQN